MRAFGPQRTAHPAPGPDARREDPEVGLVHLQRQAGNRAVAAAVARLHTGAGAPVVQRELSDDEALEATRSLPAPVQSGNGGGAPLADDAHRREFLRAGREWFGSHDATIAHFRAIRATAAPGSPQLHPDAAARLEAAAAEVGGRVPASSTAFALRSRFTAATHLGGASMHTLGYAIDYDAYNMPRIGRTETAELVATVMGAPSNLRLGEYSARRGVIERTGDATASAAAAAAAAPAPATPDGAAAAAPAPTDAGPAAAGPAATPADPASAALLARIPVESARLSATSTGFQGSLGGQGAAFLELRTRYFEAAPADRPAILAQVPAVIAPWTTAITTAEQAIGTAAQAAGLTAATIPAARALSTEVTRLQAIPREVARQRRPRGAGPEPVAAELTRLAGLERTAGVDPAAPPPPTYDERTARVVAAAAARVTLLEPLVGARERLARLTSLRGLLGRADFLFGAANRPRGGARPGTDRVVSSPSMAQLLEHGFYTTGTGQDGHVSVDFLVALARHGFDIGGAWGGESTDSMHMELVVHRPTG
ncbi:hypothetical protein [Cellulomonas sp. NS3]|uniref:hypothetical protein n=1 Tax=Cellulomonas sp. NS3 TaxID=2973977 RepID=UPI002162E87C|nr:hypothetical protein [Cellulomonas sp. NS3]